MRFWTHDRFDFPLPPEHKFPLPKYRLLRERVIAEGIAAVTDVHESEPAAWELLSEVHQAQYLERVREGTLSDREIRRLGLPWSHGLVERGRRSTQGTVNAARDALRGGYGMNLGGGTHHAGRAAGRGYCLFNDLAVAIAALRADHSERGDADSGLGRVAIIDCDVHQGDGTAELLQPDPDVFTLSLHGGANYPFRRATSDLDVDLPSGTGDDDYLAALDGALGQVAASGVPALVFYLAGADPWEGDRLGRLSLTKPGLLARDELVLDWAESLGAAVCVALAGGYAPNVTDTVDINTATAR
ncbi:MAG: histone deacetylase, partial [Solirubrobacteraceae bacterium]|nr:histone deacetylase [Solirubrobacteraceae bacterium]